MGNSLVGSLQRIIIEEDFMTKILLRVLVLSVLLVPSYALAAGLAPWQFGMSKSQVTGFKKFGPYSEFKNGDVETYNGLFYGQKKNVQFFFQQLKLRRIGVYLYEGQNIEDATAAWRGAYETLREHFGAIETPALQVSLASKPPSSQAIAVAGAKDVALYGKTQMAPLKQPKDMSVFGSFTRNDYQGGQVFYVVVNFDSLP
jgi:hypothetical protein